MEIEDGVNFGVQMLFKDGGPMVDDTAKLLATIILLSSPLDVFAKLLEALVQFAVLLNSGIHQARHSNGLLNLGEINSLFNEMVKVNEGVCDLTVGE